jgi:UDP:flavonoid glycosyltransferase YjiC (YdhE family)
VKAFISHSGLAGMYEAIYSGTPIVASPFFCDQRSNTALLVDLGVAVELDLKHVTKEKILDALNAVINDTR